MYSEDIEQATDLGPTAICNEILRASMTLIGWRMLGAALRSIQVREAEGEAQIRLTAYPSQPFQ